ncbi:MAG TPA: hypothetical protein PLR90_02285 [Methylophilus sp.]|nr:hypothetical protein [Methylophilus sp.]HQQ32720.1 hypothetical protein [Methylophilus sp.]
MSEENKPQVANVAIQQLNMAYNPNQDRVLFRIGLQDDSELQIWLTYRVSRQLWQLLGNKTNLPTAQSTQLTATPQQALQRFEQEAQTMETLQKMDFSTAYQPRQKVQNDTSMLAVQLRYVEDNPMVPVLHMTCLEGMTASINLNHEMILAICNMLQLTAKEAGWDMGAAVAAPAAQVPDMQKVLH